MERRRPWTDMREFKSKNKREHRKVTIEWKETGIEIREWGMGFLEIRGRERL